MSAENYFKGDTSEQIIQQLSDNLKVDPLFMDYEAVLDEGGQLVTLQITTDPGSGFAAAYSFTRLTGLVKSSDDFRLVIHHQGLIDELGKFLGMEDVLLGYPEFDNKVIVKTNNAEKARALFSDSKLRQSIQDMKNYKLYLSDIENDENSNRQLVWEMEEALIETSRLRNVYMTFKQLLDNL